MVCPWASNAPDMTEEAAKAAKKAYLIIIIPISDGRSATRPTGVFSGLTGIASQWSKGDGVRSVDHALSQNETWSDSLPMSTLSPMFPKT